MNAILKNTVALPAKHRHDRVVELATSWSALMKTGGDLDEAAQQAFDQQVDALEREILHTPAISPLGVSWKIRVVMNRLFPRGVRPIDEEPYDQALLSSALDDALNLKIAGVQQ